MPSPKVFTYLQELKITFSVTAYRFWDY